MGVSSTRFFPFVFLTTENTEQESSVCGRIDDIRRPMYLIRIYWLQCLLIRSHTYGPSFLVTPVEFPTDGIGQLFFSFDLKY